MQDKDPYELWRMQRSKVEVPDDFADRVMTSIHQVRRRAWWSLLARLGVIAGRSRTVRAGCFALAFAVWMLRVASILAIFIPMGS